MGKSFQNELNATTFSFYIPEKVFVRFLSIREKISKFIYFQIEMATRITQDYKNQLKGNNGLAWRQYWDKLPKQVLGDTVAKRVFCLPLD